MNALTLYEYIVNKSLLAPIITLLIIHMWAHIIEEKFWYNPLKINYLKKAPLKFTPKNIFNLKQLTSTLHKTTGTTKNLTYNYDPTQKSLTIHKKNTNKPMGSILWVYVNTQTNKFYWSTSWAIKTLIITTAPLIIVHDLHDGTTRFLTFHFIFTVPYLLWSLYARRKLMKEMSETYPLTTPSSSNPQGYIPKQNSRL